jgi:hypothetical protein
MTEKTVVVVKGKPRPDCFRESLYFVFIAHYKPGTSWKRACTDEMLDLVRMKKYEIVHSNGVPLSTMELVLYFDSAFQQVQRKLPRLMLPSTMDQPVD